MRRERNRDSIPRLWRCQVIPASESRTAARRRRALKHHLASVGVDIALAGEQVAHRLRMRSRPPPPSPRCRRPACRDRRTIAAIPCVDEDTREAVNALAAARAQELYAEPSGAGRPQPAPGRVRGVNSNQMSFPALISSWSVVLQLRAGRALCARHSLTLSGSKRSFDGKAKRAPFLLDEAHGQTNLLSNRPPGHSFVRSIEEARLGVSAREGSNPLHLKLPSPLGPRR